MQSRRSVRCSEDERAVSRSEEHPEVSTAELERRFQALADVLQRARDSFSCRLADPLAELRAHLLKAKERFYARLALSSRFPDRAAFNPVQPRDNPFEELRAVLRSTRVNFVPLLDQFLLDHGRGGDRVPPFDSRRDVNFADEGTGTRMRWHLHEDRNFAEVGTQVCEKPRQYPVVQSREDWKTPVTEPASSAHRLDVLINEELGRQRTSESHSQNNHQ